MTELQKLKLLDIDFVCNKKEEIVSYILENVLHKKKVQICLTNAFSLVSANKDEEMKKANQSSLVLSDGMPVVWLSKLYKNKIHERVSGADLFEALLAAACIHKMSFYFLGASEDTLSLIKHNLMQKAAKLNIVGVYSPPYKNILSEEDNVEIIKHINAVKPDVLWVGMSAPKQEKWIYKNLSKLDTSMAIGVGAVFDFIAGKQKRSPLWMQRAGLEWLYRMLQEPARLWKRYLLGNIQFVVLVVRKLVYNLFHEKNT